MRIAVADVLGWLAAGQTRQQIIDDLPELNADDIRACLAYAADRERRLVTPRHEARKPTIATYARAKGLTIASKMLISPRWRLGWDRRLK
jgi:hypothetical protein